MSRGRENDAIDSSAIIAEVQKRPCLYDTNHEKYGDRAVSARCWEDIYQVLVPGWSILDQQDKIDNGKEVQKRWRSIRNSYARSFKLGKCVLPENCPPDSKRYSHHMQMMFLYTALQNKKPKSSRTMDKTIKPSKLPKLLAIKSERPTNAETGDGMAPLNLTIKTEPKVERATPNVKKESVPKTEQNHTEIYPSTNVPKVNHHNISTSVTEDNLDINSPIGEIKIGADTFEPQDYFNDKVFMHSLLPMMKIMIDIDTKLVCRIAFLTALRAVMQYKLQRDMVLKTEVTEAASPRGEERPGVVTRSTDGSLPIRKRKVRSPSPVQSQPKRRGPGRPKKTVQTQPPSIVKQEKRTNSPTDHPTTCTRVDIEVMMSDLDKEIKKVTSLAQLGTPLFMKMFNLERTNKQDMTAAAHVPVKSEPVECVGKVSVADLLANAFG